MSDGFTRSWTAEILARPPMIAPVRQYTWPTAISGEEDALARGALYARVRPPSGGSYLLTCALGFADPSVPSGVFSCPNEDEICIVAGGYAYLASAETPEGCTHLAMKPVTSMHVAPEAGLLLFVGFHTVIAWGQHGFAWESARLSWDGIKISGIGASRLEGVGWDLMADREVPFLLDLTSGNHTGGAAPNMR